MEHRYFDDLALGDRFVSPGVTVTESLIIEHALKYDPQPFHLDLQAAQQSPYGGLIASGMLSISLCFRMFIQTGIFRDSGIGSPGLDEVRWLAPVRPGDNLRTEFEVVAQIHEVAAEKNHRCETGARNCVAFGHRFHRVADCI